MVIRLWRRIRVSREALLRFDSMGLGIGVLMIAVVVFFGVIVRYTPITGQTLWTAELARLFLIGVVFWASGSIERVEGHFKFGVIEDLFKGKAKTILQSILNLIGVVSFAVLIWWTATFAYSVRNVHTQLLQWPEIIRPLFNRD